MSDTRSKNKSLQPYLEQHSLSDNWKNIIVPDTFEPGNFNNARFFPFQTDKILVIPLDNLRYRPGIGIHNTQKKVREAFYIETKDPDNFHYLPHFVLPEFHFQLVSNLNNGKFSWMGQHIDVLNGTVEKYRDDYYSLQDNNLLEFTSRRYLLEVGGFTKYVDVDNWHLSFYDSQNSKWMTRKEPLFSDPEKLTIHSPVISLLSENRFTIMAFDNKRNQTYFIFKEANLLQEIRIKPFSKLLQKELIALKQAREIESPNGKYWGIRFYIGEKENLSELLLIYRVTNQKKFLEIKALEIDNSSSISWLADSSVIFLKNKQITQYDPATNTTTLLYAAKPTSNYVALDESNLAPLESYPEKEISVFFKPFIDGKIFFIEDNNLVVLTPPSILEIQNKYKKGILDSLTDKEGPALIKDVANITFEYLDDGKNIEDYNIKLPNFMPDNIKEQLIKLNSSLCELLREEKPESKKYNKIQTQLLALDSLVNIITTNPEQAPNKLINMLKVVFPNLLDRGIAGVFGFKKNELADIVEKIGKIKFWHALNESKQQLDNSNKWF